MPAIKEGRNAVWLELDQNIHITIRPEVVP
jgi:hypothetical protein